MLEGSRAAAATSLGTLGALHVLWACGSAWPARDRMSLADAVGGFAQFPGAGACLAVATLLGVASVCVAGLPAPLTRAARYGAAATSLVLFVRGGAGLAGAMPQTRRSETFADLDRRVYSPACLVIGIAALAGTARK